MLINVMVGKNECITFLQYNITVCFTDIMYQYINTFITQFRIFKQKNNKT